METSKNVMDVTRRSFVERKFTVKRWKRDYNSEINHTSTIFRVRSLTISHLGGDETFPAGIMALFDTNSLTELEISSSDSLLRFPRGGGRFAKLRRLVLRNCISLQSVRLRDITELFPSLEELDFSGCAALEDIEVEGVGDENHTVARLVLDWTGVRSRDVLLTTIPQAFRNLKSLSIRFAPLCVT